MWVLFFSILSGNGEDGSELQCPEIMRSEFHISFLRWLHPDSTIARTHHSSLDAQFRWYTVQHVSVRRLHRSSSRKRQHPLGSRVCKDCQWWNFCGYRETRHNPTQPAGSKEHSRIILDSWGRVYRLVVTKSWLFCCLEKVQKHMDFDVSRTPAILDCHTHSRCWCFRSEWHG